VYVGVHVVPVTFQVVGDGDAVYRGALGVQLLDGLVDARVQGVEEVLGLEEWEDVGDALGYYEKSAEKCSLGALVIVHRWCWEIQVCCSFNQAIPSWR